MSLLIPTCVDFLLTFVVYRNWWFMLFVIINTFLVICRLKGILFRLKVYLRFELLAIIPPFLVAIVFKRFHIVTFILVLIVRGIQVLILKYDMDKYVYPKQRIVVSDDDEEVR